MKISFSIAIIISLTFYVPTYAQDHSGVEKVGCIQHWDGAYDIAIQGEYAYIATGTTGLQILDVSDLDNHNVVGSWKSLSRDLRSVCISDDIAYMTVGNARGLRVIDVSNPVRPVQRNYFYEDRWISDLCASGDFVYLISDNYLRIVDMSNPRDPEEVGNCQLFRASHLCVSGDYVYIISNNNEFRIYNVSNPSRPTETGLYEFFNGQLYSVYVSGDYAFTGYYSHGDRYLLVIDISDCEHPDLVGSCEIEGDINDFSTIDDFACLTSNRGLYIVDVSNPDAPEVVSLLRMRDCRALSVVGNNVFVTSISDGLRVFDISNPDEPDEVECYNYISNIYSVCINGDYAYIRTDDGIKVIDVSEQSDPTIISEYGNQRVYGLDVSGDYVFTVTDAYLDAINISNPREPECVSQCQILGRGRDVSVQGDYAYVAEARRRLQNESSRGRGLRIFNISDPENTEEIAYYGTRGDVIKVFVYGNFAYLIDVVRGLCIVDISDPEHIGRVGCITELTNMTDVFVSDNYAYVTDEDEGLFIIDVSNPRCPEIVGNLDIRTGAKSVFVFGQYAHIAYGTFRGLRIVDVSDPTNPEEIGYYNTDGDASGVTISNELVFVADFTNFGIYDATEVVDYDIAPFWAEIPSDTIEVRETDLIEFNLIAEDQNQDTLTIVMICDELPDSARFNDNDDGSGSFRWLTTWDDEGEYQPLFIVSDDEFTDSLEITIIVNNHNLTPEWVETPEDTIEVIEGDSIRFELAAYDENGDELTIDLRFGGLPDWVEFTDNGNGTCSFKWETEEEDAGIYRPQFTVSDGEFRNTLSATIIVHPFNSAPEVPTLPEHFELLPVSPNPFNNQCTVQFALPRTCIVNLILYDQHGRLIRKLISSNLLPAGRHSYNLKTKDLPTGSYLMKLDAQGISLIQRVVLLK
ncbi:MAG: beta-propeller domain-containing protein [Candidatus Hatepunaea meridiana]|nr:beta-propeller domain-containing protein [Candidatus Hatepunaea meridiana]